MNPTAWVLFDAAQAGDDGALAVLGDLCSELGCRSPTPSEEPVRNGYGYGSGDGYGYGSGDGSGYGSGYGSGNGSGNGYG